MVGGAPLLCFSVSAFELPGFVEDDGEGDDKECSGQSEDEWALHGNREGARNFARCNDCCEDC